MNGFWCQGTRFSVIIGIFAATALITPQAHATTGFEPVPAFKLTLAPRGGEAEVTIPAGLLRHTIEGDDRRIDAESAQYLLAPPLGGVALGLFKHKVCNWRIDFVYHDDRGHTYRRERGKVVHRCTGVLEQAAARARPKTLAHYGTACAELRGNGNKRALAIQCHNITK